MPAPVMCVTAGLIVVLVAAGVASAEPQGSAAAIRACGQVTVTLQPEGEGGGLNIRAKNIGCSEARRIVRRCIRGALTGGWRGRLGTKRLVLSSGNRRIGYTPVGGGGCVSA